LLLSTRSLVLGEKAELEFKVLLDGDAVVLAASGLTLLQALEVVLVALAPAVVEALALAIRRVKVESGRKQLQNVMMIYGRVPKLHAERANMTG
jgi:hypothetical protein